MNARRERQRPDFVVAPAGRDDHPGILEQPFATLARARDAVCAAKKGDPDRDVLVLLRGGTYRITEPSPRMRRRHP